MRVRTLFAFGVGAAVGAGVTYLGDPEHGAGRRAEARRWAADQGRAQAVTVAERAVGTARGCVDAAVHGFRESVAATGD